MTVDAWMTALDHPFKDSFAGLRAALLVSNDAITERIKWKAPSFCIGGDDRLTLRLPPKGGLQLIFHRGAKVKDTSGFHFEDPTGLIVWAAPDRGVVTLASPEALAEQTEALVGLADAWMTATAP